MGFAVLQSATHLAQSQDLLSWASPGFSPPSKPFTRPLPNTGKPASSAHRCHTMGHVPPSWFLTTSTVCSAFTGAGLLHPATDPGVRRVSTALRLSVQQAVPITDARFSRDASTLRRIPPSTAVPCHHGHHLHVVTTQQRSAADPIDDALHRRSCAPRRRRIDPSNWQASYNDRRGVLDHDPKAALSNEL